ncbi:MAG: hypothetical protein PHU27_07980, partial [Salinivirgaceae bacterium]|nr:hypothetical protein [Salinivirgaceae bacterium]
MLLYFKALLKYLPNYCIYKYRKFTANYRPTKEGGLVQRMRVWQVLEIGTASSSHSKKLNWNEKLPILPRNQHFSHSLL